MVKMIKLCKLNLIFLHKKFKQEEKEASANFVQKNDWAIHENSFAQTNEDSTVFNTHKN